MAILPHLENKPDYSDPVRYRKLKNGATYDNSIHRIVANPGGGNLTAFTSERARECVLLREQERINAIAAGMMSGAKVDHPGKALQRIIEEQTSIATDRDHTRTVEAARLVLQAADVMPDKQANPRNIQVNVFSDPAVARAILAATADVVEGELADSMDDEPELYPDSEQADSRQDGRETASADDDTTLLI